MKWASAVSENTRLEKAVQECAAAVREQLGGTPADFAAAFVAANFADRYADAAALLRAQLPAKTFVGCGAGGVIGAGREVEHRPGVSVVAASLPGVLIKTFHVQDDDLPSPDAPPRAWETLVGVKAVENPQFLLLADPFSLRADQFLEGLDYAFPKSSKVGGLASGATGPGGNALFLDDAVPRAGLVGTAFLGNLALETIVAQGCKPVGASMTVTACQDNVLLELDGKPPLEMLQGLVESLDPRDRELVRHSLFLGLVMDPHKTTRERGDFLIRNIVGADMQKGILAIGALLRKGQTVRFHLRDAQTSAEDLRLLLERHGARTDKTTGAMLFSCLGRGEYLYGRRDHDSQLFQRTLGALPLGGFFCNGEIGPVGGTTHLHGYTSCFGLFRPKS